MAQDLTRRGMLAGAAAVPAISSQSFSELLTSGLGDMRFAQSGAGAVVRTIGDKLAETRTLEDFGAIGDCNARGVGTDDTAAIQAAIDWMAAAPQWRAVHVLAKNYLCGQVTVRPGTRLIGTGPHTSNFICKPGTIGKWWSDRGNGAQKIVLTGMAFYGSDNRALTHVLELGNDGVQFGTEGWLDLLWVRDARNAYGLCVDANVGWFGAIAALNVRCGVRILGNGNHVNLLEVGGAGERSTGVVPGGPPEVIGLDLSGSLVRGAHVEATLEQGLPLRLNGDCHVGQLCISTVTGYAHSHLIEVDEGTFAEWSAGPVQLLGEPAPVANGMVKRLPTEVYFGGTSAPGFTGRSVMARLPVLHRLARQAFGLCIRNTRGTIQHAIGQMSDPAVAGGLHDRIANASHAYRPTGRHDSSFAAGVVIDDQGRLILDTAAQSPAEQDFSGVVSHQNTGSAIESLSVTFETTTVDGVDRVRPVITMRDANGGAVPFTSLALNRFVVLQCQGFLA